MFIGHYGIALALKKVDKKLSLGWLFIAVQLVDIVWTILVLAGVEKVAVIPGITEANPLDFVHYPFTHSLVASFGWALLIFGAAQFLAIKSSLTKTKFGLLLAFAVLSHFALDIIVHRPDLPLYDSDSYMFGFGLWNNVAVSYIVETLIFLVGAFLYFKTGLVERKSRKIGLVLFLIVMLIFNLMNLLGPPPPDTTMLAVSGLALYIIIALFGFWLDRSC